MRRAIFPLFSVFLLLAACSPPEHPEIKAIIGATVQNPNSPPLADSIVVIENGQIRAVGKQSAIPIPKDAETIKGYGGVVKPYAMGMIAAGQPANLTLDVGARIRVMRKGEWTPESR